MLKLTHKPISGVLAPVLAVILVLVLAAPVAAAPPAAPEGLSVTAGTDSISASWSPPADDGGQPITGYSVSLSGAAADNVTVVGTSHTFSSLAPGDYTVTVAAINADGTGAGTSGSATIVQPVTTPSVPADITATVTGQSVTVSWSASADDGGDPFILYLVSVGGITGETESTSITFDNVPPGTYTAGVAASNTGGTSAAGSSAPFTVDAPVSAPSAPTGVSGSVSGQSVTVSWSASADDGGDPAITYSVSFGAESTTTTGTSVTFTGVAPGTYTASVTASNSGGTSAAGSSAPFTVDPPIGTPGAPENATASVDGQTVNVSWTPPSDNGGDPAITYEITLGGQTPQSTTGTSASFSNVPPGTYSATITASNLAGEGGSAQTNSVTVNAPADVPAAPGDLTVTPAGLGVAVSWSTPADNGSPITSYTVTLNGSASTFGSSPASYATLAPGSYTVTVAATNGVGTGPAAGPVSFTIEQPVEAPGTPSNVNASVSGQTVNVTWSRPDDGGDPDLSYEVSLSGGPSQTVTSPSASFTNVAAGDYSVSVTATNSAGTSGASVSSSFSVFTRPGTPTNLAAAADGSSVVATWQAPSVDGNRPLTGYQVRLELNNAVVATQDVGAGTTSARFDNLTPEVYRVVVSAQNDQGIGNGAAVDVEVGSTAPSAPTNVSASASFQTVTVTWDPPLSAGNTALTGYEVTVGSAVQTVGSGTRSAVLADIEPGTYIAEVRAINSGGKSLAGESGSFKTETVFSPFESAEALVSQQYADFLGRAPDRAGIAYWQGVL
ncbi:MAG: PKD domain-containing protein, partial [Acidimicrobiales bacterium]|nr:PKD domain-containing protein [Acidimicrobiales bacterium]